MFEQNRWVYYSCLLVCAICAIVMNASNSQYSLLDAATGEKKKRQAIVYAMTFVMIGYIVFWAAIRNGVVDTAEYIQVYNLRVTPEIDLKKLFSSDVKAPLFELYQKLMKRMGATWQDYLAVIAIVTGWFVFIGISKYSDDVVFSCYLFITTLNFLWMFNGIRQFLVASVIFASFRLIAEKKFWKFLLLIIILYFFHKTVIIMIPIYFIAHLKNWSYGIYACILTTMAVALIFPNQLVNLLNDSFTEYGLAQQTLNDDGVNILRVMVAMVAPIIAYVYREKIAELDNKYVNALINFSLISAGLYAVGVNTSGIFIGRLPLYTDMFGIILLPFLIKRILPKQVRGPIWIMCLLLYFLYCYLQLNNGYYYTTNWFPKLDLGGAQL